MLISIITINYNNVIGLKKTCNSIEEQTYQDFEFVVIDGGSSDDSVNVIKASNKISYWVSEKDTGVYHAMNKGIKKANGKYVIFMNSGDVFYDKEVLNDFINDLNENHDMVYGNSLFYNDDGYLRKDSPPEVLSFAFLKDSGINHQAVFIKKQLFYDTFFYNEDYKISADWEFFIRNICLNNISYKKKDRFVCRYDFSGISAVPENYQTYLDERKVTLTKYFNSFIEESVEEEVVEEETDKIYKETLKQISHKRMDQFIFMRKYKITWKITRGVINICLFFIPKKDFQNFINK